MMGKSKYIIDVEKGVLESSHALPLSPLLLLAGTLLIGFTMGACNKLVDPGTPKTSISGSAVYSNSTTATAAIDGIYATMVDFGNINNTKAPALSSDELVSYSAPVSRYYKNALNASVDNDFWSNFYNYIYQCNVAIEQLSKSTGINDSIRNQLIGEAMFLRAFSYFYLVNYFGDVPYLTTSNYQANTAGPRQSAVNVVYPAIIKDLVAAQGLLSSDYPTSERVRANKAVATALLSRVYLYTKDYLNAEAQASQLIDNSNYQLEPDLNSVFLNTSREAIWQLSPTNTYYSNAAEGNQFILVASPVGSGTVNTAISDSLLNTFETGDLRQTNWIGTYTTFHYPYKYKVRAMSQPAKEYSTVLRLAEQYLIRSEARAHQNKINDAVSDLNLVRARAGLGPLPGSISQAECLDHILHERRVELFVEWGHRWFDLKRTGQVDAVMTAVAPSKGITWNTDWQLYPIPQAQLTADPDMKGAQNPGY